MAVAQDQLALSLMAADPIRIKRIAFAISIATAADRRCAADHHPAGRAVGRSRIYRPRIRHLRARRHGQPSRHGHRRHAARHRRKHHLDLLWPVMGAGGRVRLPPDHAGRTACRTSGTIMRTWQFSSSHCGIALAGFLGARLLGNDYLFFAGYVVLQFIVLATAWNILGGYCGYVNFGSAAFFAIGAYYHRGDDQAAGFRQTQPAGRSGRHRRRHHAALDAGAGHSRRPCRRPRRPWHRLSDARGCVAYSSPSPRWRSRSCCRRWW